MKDTEASRRRAARVYSDELRRCAFAAEGYLHACVRDEITLEAFEVTAVEAMRTLSRALEREAMTGKRRPPGGAA
jgi:hypothetical protein